MSTQHQQNLNQRYTPAHKVAKTVANGVLSSEKTQAMQQLITLTQNLNDLADRESQALAQNDMLSFTVLQDEKALIADHYSAAATEFRNRINEFRGMNPALINRLENLQSRLGETSKQNNAIIKRVYDKAKANTQDTLLTAQEISEKTHANLSAQSVDKAQNNEVKHG